VVSEQSFPLSVVEVESAQQGKDPKPSATNENLDTSTNNSGGEDTVMTPECVFAASSIFSPIYLHRLCDSFG
jgi:hypothetical protein